jgi:RNA polymerase sigma factor (sigma-70 family)
VSSEEFSRLIEQVLPGLELYARQWSREPADIVQEACLRLWKQEIAPQDARAWLFRVVRNLSISQLRNNARRQVRETCGSATDESWFELDPGQRLDAADVTRRLQNLPEELREPVIAHVWGELTFHEIGELVGASASTVHRRYQQAMDQLRNPLRPTCPSSPIPTAIPTT